MKYPKGTTDPLRVLSWCADKLPMPIHNPCEHGFNPNCCNRKGCKHTKEGK